MFLNEGATPTTEHQTPPVPEKVADEMDSDLDITRPFLEALANGPVTDMVVRTFLEYVSRYCHQHHLLPMELPPDHPVEELGRYVISITHIKDPSTPIFPVFRNPTSYILAQKLLYFLYFDIKLGTIWVTAHSITDRDGPEV